MKKGRARKTNDFKQEPVLEAGDSDFPSLNKISESRILFLIVAATVLVYGNSLSGSFVYDDTKQIVGNPHLHSWGNAFRAFTSDVWSFQRETLSTDISPAYYRPLFTAYLTLNYKLFGLWEPGWHLMNLLVHVAVTVAVYFLLKRLSGNRLVAALATMIFGLHPAHVESISWISGIPDPLAALFYVPSLLWYVRYREEGGGKWLTASVVAFGLGILCKETPLVLPLVLCAWELTRQTSKPRPALALKQIGRQMVPYAVVGAAYLMLRFSILGRINWTHPVTAQVPDLAAWMTVPFVFVSYLQHLIAPFHLSLIYGTYFITSVTDPRFLLPVGVLASLGIILWIYRKKLSPQVWVGIVMTVAPILPVLNLKVFHDEYIIQDRYLYLSSIGFCYLVAILILRVARKRAAMAAALSVVVLLLLGASTILQNRVWHDSVALWERAVNYSPNSWSTHYNLGVAYLGRKQYETARIELLEARRLQPNQAKVLNNLALAQSGLADTAGATENLKAALALEPGLLEAHNNLGTLLYEKGDYAGAKGEFSLVLKRDPLSSSARFNLARTLAAMSDHAGAVREYEALITKEPNDVAALYQLGLSYAAMGRKGDAITQLGRGLQMDKDGARSSEMRQKLEQIQAQ